jgi:elongation of very long chain fatty acids protein 6
MDAITEFFGKMNTFAYEDTFLLLNYTHSLPWISVGLYALMVFILPKILKKPVPGMDAIMAIWNLFLTVLSVAMLVGVVPTYLDLVRNYGFWTIFCDTSAKMLTPGKQVFWGYIFSLSKYAELLDTLWLILKKPDRPVQFLHWYHHITVLLFTWYAEYWKLSVGMLFIIMNSLVHSFMYFYYFLTAIGINPKHMALPITIGQISQMFFGMAIIGVWAYRVYVLHEKCLCTQPDLLALSCAIMYGSYFYLFVSFFIKRYCGGRPQKKKEEKKKTQ